ncbi:MAG: DegT/DnrJ/EryC1/StrS family aminotransferase [Candidatus Omnitrophota bacterium]
MVSIMKIPFISLKEQHRAIRVEVRDAVSRVFDSQQFILKDSVAELEAKVARFTGTKYAVSVASGSDALYLALWALGIKAGDEVLTTPFTFFASASAISRLGAKPVFADIDPCTFNLDPSKLEDKISRKTKAILPVHLFGLCCDMSRVMKIARKHGLAVVEDAAQAFGSECQGRRAGSIGDAGCFSFYPTKNFGGAGDGGMVTTSSRETAEKIRLLRDHGSSKKYHHDLIGINSRLDEIQAAVLLVKFKHIQKWNRKREGHARFYDRELRGLPLQRPSAPAGFEHTYHLYSILADDRDALKVFLEKRGVGVAIHYPLPLHLQAWYKELGHRKGDLPVSESVSKRILSLPMYPELSARSRAFVVSSIRAFYGKAR